MRGAIIQPASFLHFITVEHVRRKLRIFKLITVNQMSLHVLATLNYVKNTEYLEKHKTSFCKITFLWYLSHASYEIKF